MELIRSILLFCEKKLPFMGPFWLRVRKLKYDFKNLLIMFGAYFRKFGFIDLKYIPLKKYKNKHKGEHCFIIATGPSLTYDDLNKLKNEITFSMNSIIKSYEQTDFRPTYYGIQDELVFEKLYEDLYSYRDEQIVFYNSDFIKGKNSIPKNWIPMKINADYHRFDYNYNTGKYFAKFSDNAYSIIYDGYSITYSLIQIAVYMGFTTIYLLGCDSFYSNDPTKQHFVDYGHSDPLELSMKATDRLSVAYLSAKKFAEKKGVKIINATRGGKLEVFERQSLEDILGIK